MTEGGPDHWPESGVWHVQSLVRDALLGTRASLTKIPALHRGERKKERDDEDAQSLDTAAAGGGHPAHSGKGPAKTMGKEVCSHLFTVASASPVGTRARISV